jgi:hypothetical protein
VARKRRKGYLSGLLRLRGREGHTAGYLRKSAPGRGKRKAEPELR